MITYDGDSVVDTSTTGTYGLVTNIRTRTLLCTGGYQPPNYTYQYNTIYANQLRPLRATVTTPVFPWSSRSEEAYTVIVPNASYPTLIDQTRMTVAPTAVDGWWEDGELEQYVLKGQSISRLYDEHHSMIAIETGDLSIPAWACSQAVYYWIPGYGGSGASLVTNVAPTDSRAFVFPYHFPYTDEKGTFGGIDHRMQPLGGVFQYVMDLYDGAVYAPFLETNSASGLLGPMWWGVPSARLVAYGVTPGNSGGVGIPGSYTVTLKGQDRRGNLTTIQTFTGSVPVVQYDAANDRSAIGLDTTLTMSASLPADHYVYYQWTSSVDAGTYPYIVQLEVPFTPALHPGMTNPQATGTNIPMGYLMKVAPAI